jgi:ribosomal protein L37E
MPENFRTLVLRMRTAQKQYFAHPNQTLLNECKRLEQRVDRWLMLNAAEQIKIDSWVQTKSLRCPGCGELKTEETVYCTKCGINNADQPRSFDEQSKQKKLTA